MLRKSPRLLVALCSAQNRVGKDTLASALETRESFHRYAFSDALYREVSEAFSVPESLLRTDHFKTTQQRTLSLGRSSTGDFVYRMHRLGFDVNQPRTSREILQLWAHEYRRADYPLYWVQKLFTRAIEDAKATKRHMVISDLRYSADELPAIHSFARDYEFRPCVLEVKSDLPKAVVAHRDGVKNHGSTLPDVLKHADWMVFNKAGDPDSMTDAALHYLRRVQDEC